MTTTQNKAAEPSGWYRMSTRQDSKRCQEFTKTNKKKSDAVQCQVQDKPYLDWTLISQNLCGIQVYHHGFTDNVTVIKSTVLREQTEFGILPFLDCKKTPPNYWTVLMRTKVKIKRFRYSEQNSLYKVSTAKNKQVWWVKPRWIEKVQKTTICLKKSDILLYSIFEEETLKLRWQAETLIWIKKKKKVVCDWSCSKKPKRLRRCITSCLSWCLPLE